MHEHLCLLSALSASCAGPFEFVSKGDRGDLARKIAMQIVTNSEEGHSLDAIQDMLEESLKLSHDQEGAAWMEEYLGWPREHAWPRLPMEFEDPYFDIALVIGRDPDDSGEHADEVLKRVDDSDEDREWWETLITIGYNAQSVMEDAAAGIRFFCWERPYQYFESWMRHSCPSLASLGGEAFAEQFHRVVDSMGFEQKYFSYVQITSTSTGPADSSREARINKKTDFTGLTSCISYGGIERTHAGSFQNEFVEARTQSTNTAAAIASGARGKDLWPAFALDFNAWMAMRPVNSKIYPMFDDLRKPSWPTVPSSSVSASTINLDSERPTHSTQFHTIPPEVLVQVLQLVSVSNVLSLLQLSRGISERVKPLLDETLWHHVHHGDLRWILPVPEVKGEVNRANEAVKGWYSNPTTLPSVFDSREFPFARFLSECVRSGSMRNRRRLWKIFKQFKVLWEAMGTTLE
ncbi:hypothetical protein DFH09DRAFT_1096929 [Mycena vulgaris]|nr:hypothetical protein DFH09DRAFT_1096929 [Mycena vulgaris]